MAEKYYGDITFDTDWGGDASTQGLPVAGLVINNFVRANLKNSFRDMFFDPNGNTMYFFKTSEDKELFVSDPQTYASLPIKAIPLEFSGTIRQARLINQLPSTSLSFTTNQTEANVSVQYICQEKSISDEEWHDTSYGGMIKVFVDAGSTGEYVEIQSAEKHLIANETFTFNIRNYINAGGNTVKLQVVADDDKSTIGTIIYSVYLSEMYIEPLNLNWHTAFVEGNDGFALGGFRVVGALAKTLHIKITKGTHTYHEFEKYVGTASYITSPLFFLQSDIPEGETLFPDGGTGVYQADAWLTAGTLESQHVIYPIMCITEADKNYAQLVAMYNVAPVVYNYDRNHLFDLAVYNKGLSTGTPHVKVRATNEGSTAVVFKDEDLTVSTDTVIEYSLNIEWITEAVSALSLYVEATYADAQEVNSIPIDNSGAYPATSGYSLYINAANRTNSQTNRESIINEADGSVITPEWTHMAWVDGIDGWTNDDANRNCLRIPAGSKVSIPFQVLRSDNIAFDITFKATNVADYDENIITIATNPSNSAFQGIRIKPTNITIHNSDDVGPSRDIQQGINFSDEEVINLFVTIARNYNGNQGKNLVTGYINGTKNFQFEYGNVVWANEAPIIIGADKADVFVYSVRAYRTALGVSNAEANFINSLASRLDRIDEKKKLDSVLNGLHQIDYEKVKNGGFNYFVVEMLNGASVPQRANGWAKDAVGFSNFEMHFGEHPLWDFKLYYVETSGQGTTSMDYYRWNLRWRIDKTDAHDDVPKKNVKAAYFDMPTRDAQGNIIYHEKAAQLSTSIFFDGGTNDTLQQHPKLMRITAKTNAASSMQSHKIGATRAYTALHDAVVGYNEAQQAAEDAGTPIPTVAVYEYPAFGFSKVRIQGTDAYEYQYIGLFTIGPDKGDKPTFGYDTVKNSLMTLEGTDHAPRLATFRYPWNDDVQYRASNECLNIVTGTGADDLEKAWEASNVFNLDTAKEADEPAIQERLESDFKPAYDVAYKNSTLIHAVALGTYGVDAAATLAYINAHKSSFNDTAIPNTTYKYSDFEFWIEGEYVLYYEDKRTGLYTAGVNLLEQCGITEGDIEDMSLTQQNEYFKGKRRDFFKNGNTNTGHEIGAAGDYWDLTDCEFCFAFLIIFGASDNFAKNSYPQKMKSIADGGKWGWRQDDLDTLGDIDNQGKDTKPYYIEFKDDSNGTPYFNGSSSVFWNLLFECYWDEIRAVGKSVLDTMRNLGGGQNTYQGIMNFMKKYFWDNAQNYFPKSAYNEDASYKYEASWLDPVNGQVTVAPLTQSLGDHYRAEYQWFSRRAIYAMSLFHAGPFGIGGYTDSSLGLMSFRATIPSLNLKTSIAFYPALHVGTNTLNNADRVMPNGIDMAAFINPSGGEDTTVYIPATDWLSDLGDLKALRVLGDNVKALAVNGKRLRTFKLGDEDDSIVTTNIETLSFTNTPSLETIDCRNVASLGGTLDLSACTRLSEAYLGGTLLVSVKLPNGSKIETLQLPDAVKFLQLRNLKFLEAENFEMPSELDGITNLQIEGCTHLDAFEMLTEIFTTEGNTLRYIRVVWGDIKTMSADSVDMLAQIADGTREGLYHGITPDGQVDDNANPTIEGDLEMETGIYVSSLDRLGVDPSETEDLPDGRKRAIAKIFGTMHIIYNPDLIFIEFEDDEAKRLCATAWGDGVGLTLNQAQAVTSLGNTFVNNTLIEKFNELRYFTGVTKMFGGNGGTSRFGGCTNLTELSVSASVTQFETNWTPPNIQKIGIPSLEWLLRAPSVLDWQGGIWKPAGVSLVVDGEIPTVINIPDTITTIKAYILKYCSQFTSITGFRKVTTIGKRAFEGCTGLTSIAFPETITSLGEYAFSDCTGLTSIAFPENPLNQITISQYCFNNVGNSDTIWEFPANTILAANAGGSIKGSVIYIGANSTIGSDCFTSATAKKFVLRDNCILDNSNRRFYIFYALPNCELIIFGAGLQNLDKQNALIRGSKSSIRLLFKGNSVVALGSSTFQYMSPGGIFVPYALVDSYKAAGNWSSYASKIYGYFEAEELPAGEGVTTYCLMGDSLYHWNGATWDLIA